MRLGQHMKRLGLSDAAVAAKLGVSAEAVRLWRHGLRRVSAERAMEIERALDIPRGDLRPDLWPSSEKACAA